MGMSREEQDDYALESYKRTEEAMKSGAFDREIVAVDNGKKVVTEDEEVGSISLYTSCLHLLLFPSTQENKAVSFVRLWRGVENDFHIN